MGSGKFSGIIYSNCEKRSNSLNFCSMAEANAAGPPLCLCCSILDVWAEYDVSSVATRDGATIADKSQKNFASDEFNRS